MHLASGTILCLAYILGLGATAIPFAEYGVLLLGVGAAFLSRRFWKTGPRPRIWIAAGMIGFLASLYLQVRLPSPETQDISRLIPETTAQDSALVATVQGQVTSLPRLTRSQKAQFWLQANQVSEIVSQDKPATVNQAVTGKLYVTVPLLQGTGLRPGQAIAVTGSLYRPKPAVNPGGFDFQAYLAQEGCFAGLSGRQVTIPDNVSGPKWGWWVIRQQIIRAQVRWLGSPEGPLVSSMVLGGKSVDLPYDIRDQFAQGGLAHALAASGFQTSLILGLVLALTRRLDARIRFGCGVGALAVFVGLAGCQPAILRAALMGCGALVALVLGRQIKPLGSLLFTATLLLVFNPLWIWNLGFQLSLLATLGLVVTVPAIIKRLDWLPPAIATLFAVPIAAYLWTLPLQLYAFGSVSPYSILVNVLTTPLVSVISIGGVISALAALMYPLAGSATAWLLQYPTDGLLAIVDFFNDLPGSSVAVGTISSIQLLALYGLILLVWLWDWWRSRWWIAGLAAMSLISIPIWHARTTMLQATVLATPDAPVLVLQDRGRIGLINSGNEITAGLSVLPFLQQQGINQINWAIATDFQGSVQTGWTQVLKRLPIQAFYDGSSTAQAKTPDVAIAHQAIVNAIQSHRGDYQILAPQTAIRVGSITIHLVSANPTVLELQIKKQSWLWLDDLKVAEQMTLVESGKLPTAEVLWWNGTALTSDFLKAVQPKIAIASAASVDPETIENLKVQKIQLYWTGQDGALQWTPEGEVTTTIDFTGNDAALL